MRQIKNVLLTVFLVIPLVGMSQFAVPPIDLKISAGFGSHTPFDSYYYDATGSDYQMDSFHAGLQVDVWVTRYISIGLVQQRSFESAFEISQNDEYWQSEFKSVYSGIKVKFSSSKTRRVSFYIGPSFYAMQHYFESMNMGRKAFGPALNIGMDLNFGDRFTFNVADINAHYLNTSLMADFADQNLFFDITGGFSYRIFESR